MDADSWPVPSRISLPPGPYFLPHTWGSEQIDRLVWLLQRGLSAASTVAHAYFTMPQADPRTDPEATLLVFHLDAAQATDSEGLTARLAALPAKYVFFHDPHLTPETASAMGWVERYLKPPILHLLRRHLASTQPERQEALLHALSTAAGLTADPLELWQWVSRLPSEEANPAHPAFADRPTYVLLYLAGRSLGERLAVRTPAEVMDALEILWGDPTVPLNPAEHPVGSEALAELGHARIVAGDVSLGALARQALLLPIATGLGHGAPRSSGWEQRLFQRMLWYSRRLAWEGARTAAFGQLRWLAMINNLTDLQQVYIQLMRSEILIRLGRVERAESVLRHIVLPMAQKADVPRLRATAMGMFADIREDQGRLGEALRIRREEVLPIHERLGDVRERATTLEQIAEIYQLHGQLDESLRIFRDDTLPLYQKVGDVHACALTLGRIANIYRIRGQLEQALHIYREDVLPILEKVGDLASRAAILGRMADIYVVHGQLDEALRIYREELLPAYEKLGAVRERTVTLGKIADIHEARGQLDEALQIYREQVLPVFANLGVARERVVTLVKIADIYRQSGNYDDAMMIYKAEALPIYEKIGDVREWAMTMGRIADIYEARGQRQEALRIYREEELPVYENLGLVRERAITLGRIADIYYTEGLLNEALAIRISEELPAYNGLGDVRSRAVTQWKIADIYQNLGQPDPALRLLREEVLPVFQRLKSVRDVLLCEMQVAACLLQRSQPGDGKDAEALLRHALEEALALQLPEVKKIQILLDSIESV